MNSEYCKSKLDYIKKIMNPFFARRLYFSFSYQKLLLHQILLIYMYDSEI